jgi:RNA polymerase sigma-70 factor (ECF subfamily)
MKQNMEKRKKFEAQALPQLENLYFTALYMLQNHYDAQDLVGETYIKAYSSWREYQFVPDCRVWLFRTMASILINKYWSSHGLSVAINSTDEIDGYLIYSQWVNQQSNDNSDRDFFSMISEDDVKRVIKSLPDDLRLIIVLSLLEGFSYREIADIAGINLKTVKSKLYEGRKLMQKELFGHMTLENNYDMSHRQSQE